jgi:tRNA threonylcarbamoyladenosine biosynthesis protein TsaB
MNSADPSHTRCGAELKCNSRTKSNIMNLLAFETSSFSCSVALLEGGAVVEEEFDAGQTHSGMVLPMALRLLQSRGVDIGQIDGVAYGAGPGSFTGLRIACGIAQGLAAGIGVAIAPVSTLEALAEGAWQRGVEEKAGAAGVIACIDARMNEVYHAACHRDGAGWKLSSPPGLYALDAIPVLSGDWIGAGSGFEAHGAKLRNRQRLVAEMPALRPRAAIVARLAVAHFARGSAVAAGKAVPVYLRDKVALTVSERRHERDTAA